MKPRIDAMRSIHQEVLDSISHELRTPLTAILGNATAIKTAAHAEDSALQAKLADDIVQSAIRLDRAVENILDITRASTDVSRSNKDIFELNDFISSSIQDISELTSTHRVLFELSADDLFILCSEKDLEHAVRNLVLNAVQFSPQGSTIVVDSRLTEGFAEFSILDEGKGIPEEDLKMIFKRFYRAPGTPQGGVGLGLAVAKLLIEVNDGTVSAANRTDRSGAIFRVRLPSQSVPKDVFE